MTVGVLLRRQNPRRHAADGIDVAGGKLEAAVDVGKERAQVGASHPARKVVQGKEAGEEGARVEARMNADGKNRGFSHG